MKTFAIAVLAKLATKGTLHTLPKLHNNEPVPQVLKQVVDLSCYLWNRLEKLIVLPSHGFLLQTGLVLLFKALPQLLLPPLPPSMKTIMKFVQDFSLWLSSGSKT